LAARNGWLSPYSAAATLLLASAYLMGPDVYLPPAIPWPVMRLHLREFVVKLASIPAWLTTGLWALSILRQGAPARAEDTPKVRLATEPGPASWALGRSASECMSESRSVTSPGRRSSL